MRRSRSRGRTRSPSSGETSGTQRHHGASSSEASLSRRFVSVESGVAALTATLALLSAALLSPVSGSLFSGFQLPVFPGVSGVTVPAAASSPHAHAGDGGLGWFATHLHGSVTGLGGVQAPSNHGFSTAAAGAGGSGLHTAPLPGLFPGVSGVQAPASQALPAGFASVRGVSLCAAPLPVVAPGVCGVSAPAAPVSCEDSAGFGGVSLPTTTLSGVAGVRASAGPGVSAEVERLSGLDLHASPLPGFAVSVSGSVSTRTLGPCRAGVSNSFIPRGQISPLNSMCGPYNHV